MLRYYLQQFFFQIIGAVAVILLVGLFFYAKAVEKNDPAPTDVKMQFHDSLGKPRQDASGQISLKPSIAPGQAVSPQLAQADLSIKHMSSLEVAELLEIMLAECLSFSPSNFDKNSRLVQSYFTPQGYQQYTAYLEKTNFGGVIKSRNLQSGAYTERPPLEINSLVQNGVYKWLFEVPVTLSFIPVNSETYRGGATTAQNQRFTLRVQLTRVKDDKNPNKISIEIWQMMPPRG